MMSQLGNSSSLTKATGAELITGSDDDKFATAKALADSDYHRDYILIRDQKAQNVSGGASAAATWNVRTLNTEVTDTSNLATVASNRITLVAGTYRIQATAPHYGAQRSRLRLRNVTDSTDVLYGPTGVYNSAAEGVGLESTLVGVFTIAASKELELQHYTQVAKATDGLGIESNVAAEYYAQVELWRI